MVLSEAVSTTDFFLLCAVGRLLIYLAQKAPYKNWFKDNQFFKELFDCQLCLGVWIYALLSAVFRKFLFCDIFSYIPVLSELVTGSVLSFIMFLVSSGWDARFRVIYMED